MSIDDDFTDFIKSNDKYSSRAKNIMFIHKYKDWLIEALKIYPATVIHAYFSDKGLISCKMMTFYQLIKKYLGKNVKELKLNYEDLFVDSSETKQSENEFHRIVEKSGFANWNPDSSRVKDLTMPVDKK